MHGILIKEVSLPFETVIKKLPYQLRRHGFELLSTIHIDKELHDSLGIDHKCCALFIISNLQIAYKTLLHAEESALLQFIPLLIYHKNKGTAFATLRPTQLFPILQSNSSDDGAIIIEKKLTEVLDVFYRKSSNRKNKKTDQQSESLLKAVA